MPRDDVAGQEAGAAGHDDRGSAGSKSCYCCSPYRQRDAEGPQVAARVSVRYHSTLRRRDDFFLRRRDDFLDRVTGARQAI
jgi:hypothetical protein